MSIPGQCVSAAGQIPVMISRLDADGCDMCPVNRTADLDGPLWLWLGAIGPLPIAATRLNSTTFDVRFKEPLDDRIVEHFAGSKRARPREKAARRAAVN